MNVMKKVALQSVRQSKKRTVVTIIGVILATALLTAVANMAESLRASVIQYERDRSGDFHYLFQGVDKENLKYYENNRYIQRISYSAELGYAELVGSQNADKPYVYLQSFDKSGWKAAAFKLTDGRMPETEDEIVIARHIRTNGGVDIKIGDKLTLQVGNRVADDGSLLKQNHPYMAGEETLCDTTERTYRVVGIMERPSYTMEVYTAPGYTVVTGMAKKDAYRKQNLFVTYTREGLKKCESVTTGLLGTSEDVFEHEDLIKWELMRFSDGIMALLYSMTAIALFIIIVTAVFCIRNSFAISLTEKLRLYGMLASVGATKRQRRKIVYYEAAFVGAIGIPIGVLSGILATLVIVCSTKGLMKSAMDADLKFVISWPAIVLGSALAIVTLFVSASRTAGRAARLTPISAIRSNDTVKTGRRKLKSPAFLKKCFGIGGVIAYKNLKRAKVKYRTTVVSIIVSVAMVISMTTFMELVFKVNDIYYDKYGYQLEVVLQDADALEEAYELAELPGVKEYNVVRHNFFLTARDKVPYTRDYLEYYEESFSEETVAIEIYSIGRKPYKEYCRKIGLSPEKAGSKAIVWAGYQYFAKNKRGNQIRHLGDITDYHPGDVIEGFLYEFSEDAITSIEVAAQTNEFPIFCSSEGKLNSISILVDDDWMDAWWAKRTAMGWEDSQSRVLLYLSTDDAGALESEIRNEPGITNCVIYNREANYRQEKSMYMLVAVFLYGFMIVITLIGVTNIFNTVTTNMELRSREFAMLRSVGMTGGEFSHMMYLESLFYGAKALCIGILAGCLLSLAFFRAFAEGAEMGYRLPVRGIVFSILGVAVLLYGIMRYSMARIKRMNIISTIQNENI
ncbi:MAG: ABC transporter permease [Roseburia sp.]|nr:ABC transporter permease [Roseburia sp.]